MSRASSSSSASQYNICLICGSHTNLVLNIFEPRCGPNIVDIIFAKFKFKAEKNSSDKYICYDCNNWLINWFSLQNLNEQQSSDPSDSGKNANVRKSMDNYNNPNKNHNQHSNCQTMPADKGIVKRQRNSRKIKFKDRRKKIIVRKSVYSCLLCKFPSIHHQIVKKYKKLLKSKIAFNTRKDVLRKTIQNVLQPPQPSVMAAAAQKVAPDLVNQNNVVSSSSCDISPPTSSVSSSSSASSVEEFDDRILKMLKKQGTVVFSETDEKKSKLKLNYYQSHHYIMNNPYYKNNSDRKSNDIVINFNSDITEVLKIKKCKDEEMDDQENDRNISDAAIVDQLDKYFKLPKSLSISVLASDDDIPECKPKSEPIDNKFWKVNNDNLVSIVID